MNNFDMGRYDTYTVLGIEKTSGWVQNTFKPGWFRRLAIGEPSRFIEELKSGRALSSKKMWNPDTKQHEMSLMRESLHAPGVLNKTLFWGMPAWQAYDVMRSGSPTTNADLAGLVGSTLAYNSLFRPLGIVGSALAAYPMEAIGRRLGGLFKSKQPSLRPEGLKLKGSPLTY